jgi:hypothetical protein
MVDLVGADVLGVASSYGVDSAVELGDGHRAARTCWQGCELFPGVCGDVVGVDVCHGPLVPAGKPAYRVDLAVVAGGAHVIQAARHGG